MPKIKDPVKNWAREMNRYFSEVEQMAINHMKTVFKISGEMKVKATVKFHFISERMAIIKEPKNKKC